MTAPQESREAQASGPPAPADAQVGASRGAEEQSRTPQDGDSRAGATSTAGADRHAADEAASRLVSELEGALQRERADFLNYRRRTAQERDESSQAARTGVYQLLLPILDDLELAVAQTPAPSAHEPFVEGYRLVARKILRVLQQAGVERTGTVGEPFDPHAHEAIGQRPPAHASERPGTVGEVVRPGYRLQDHILRPAQVIVVSEPDHQNGGGAS